MRFFTQRTTAWLLVSFCLTCVPGGAQSVRHRRASTGSEYARRAVEALFSNSDLTSARDAAHEALKLAQPGGSATPAWQLDALFVEMESAALEGDTPSELEAALRICELRSNPNDVRVRIAAYRVLDRAGNTSEFRTEIPRIQNLLKSRTTAPTELRAALLSAAADGAPGLSALELARQSGLITDWRIAGPFGELPNVGFERVWEPEGDLLVRPKYGKRQVEEFQFATGTVTVPNYFSTDGVFYAASSVTTLAGDRLLRIESAGTLQAWVDGRLVLTKDERFHAGPEAVGDVVQLKAGTHRLLIKFINSALPFRVALVPSERKKGTRTANAGSDIPKDYLDAAEDFWAGNYNAAVKTLSSATIPEGTAVKFLMAQARLRAGDSDNSRVALFTAALQQSPSAHAVNHELATIALAQGREQEAMQREQQVIEAQPRFEAAARVLAAAASKLERRSEAARAFQLSTQLHPSCTVLKDASEYFDSVSEFGAAERYEVQLRDCAPGSLAWAEALAKAGRHREAASAARQVVAQNPLDRNARALLVEELKLAGEQQRAKIEAEELAAIAPNAREFRRVAAELGHGGKLASGVSRANPREKFYSAYRRNGLEIAKEIKRDKYSGAAAVLLNDKVVEVNGQGSASVYVHKITRVLDRDGILRFGEVSVPSDAELLELRTIKTDGSIVEPELTPHKSTISMPALAAGDAIEVEYVVRDGEGGVDEHPSDFQFVFGSFSAPIALSRFVVLSPALGDLRFVQSGALPAVKVVTQGAVEERIWEQNDIAQSSSETSMPQSGVLPAVSVIAEDPRGWVGVRDFYREEFIAAARVGSGVESTAREFLSRPTNEERLREAYRFVTRRVRRGEVDYESGEIPTAEKTLGSFSGSRTALLLAIAKAMGIEGKVLMARDVSPQPLTVPSAHAYTRPLLLFQLRDADKVRDIVLDAETEGIGFGGISATLERHDALLVSVYEATTEPAIAAVPKPLFDDYSDAEGEVTFNENGDLAAHLVIRMGAARGAQMRATLAGIDPGERKRYFEQLAGRIFPGVSFAQGRVENESDPDHALTLVVDCRAERFVSFASPITELDQLVPGLGLKSMYSTGGTRRMPLLIQTPLVESATFKIHLPAGLQFQPRFHDVVEKSEFGTYSVKVTAVSPDTVEVRREFDIPVQIIEPRRFDSFSRFARSVDEAERQRLVVQRTERGRVARR